MNTASKNLLETAATLARRGISVTSVVVRTPDGRTWSIDAAAAGFRLFEIDPDDRRGPEEHDAVEGNTWLGSELADYLNAVGRK